MKVLSVNQWMLKGLNTRKMCIPAQKYRSNSKLNINVLKDVLRLLISWGVKWAALLVATKMKEMLTTDFRVCPQFHSKSLFWNKLTSLGWSNKTSINVKAKLIAPIKKWSMLVMYMDKLMQSLFQEVEAPQTQQLIIFREKLSWCLKKNCKYLAFSLLASSKLKFLNST